ncbi:ECF transporter S component, partial [Streptomyces vinaceus]
MTAAARTAAIRINARAGVVIAMAAFLGIVALFWPFLVAPGKFGSNSAPPLIFGVLLVVVLCVVISEIAEGGINSKA